MSENINYRRMGSGKSSIGQFQLIPWIDIPEACLWRNPELRDWQQKMKQREEANQETLNQLARLIQNNKED